MLQRPWRTHAQPIPGAVDRQKVPGTDVCDVTLERVLVRMGMQVSLCIMQVVLSKDEAPAVRACAVLFLAALSAKAGEGVEIQEAPTQGLLVSGNGEHSALDSMLVCAQGLTGREALWEQLPILLQVTAHLVSVRAHIRLLAGLCRPHQHTK